MPRVAEPIDRTDAPVDAAALRSAQLSAYFQALPTVLGGNLVAAVLVLWSIDGRLDRVTAGGWFAVHLLALGGRVLLAVRFRRADARNVGKRWLWGAVIGSFITGAVWGVGAFLFFVPGQIEPQAILILAICVLNTAGAGVLSTFRPAYFASLLPCLPLLSLRLLLDGDRFRPTWP
jgi:hypothetical protein